MAAENMLKSLLDRVFESIARRLSFTAAIVSYSLTGAWFAGGYAYFFATPSLPDWSFERYPLEFIVFLGMMLLATVGHMAHFGTFRFLGIRGFGDGIVRINGLLEGGRFREENDIQEVRNLLLLIDQLPLRNVRVAVSWAFAIMFAVSSASIYHTGELHDAAVVFVGWIVAASTYGGFTYIITEHFAGPTRVEVKRTLIRRGESSNLSDGASLGAKFLFLLYLMLMASVILAAYVHLGGKGLLQTAAFIGLTLAASGLLVFLYFHSILRSLAQITESAADLADGGHGSLPMISTEREFMAFTGHFERAASRVVNMRRELTTLVSSYQRFVPREFLEHLDRANIVDVNLGDQVERSMTVMFSDIREFTALSESMSPEENFNFLNSYLSRMHPVIARNGGFVDKYIGDAIMALFEAKADGAVRAAVEMQVELREYNHKRVRRNFNPIRVGTGIHCGLLMLGTIGSAERMEGTVISDAVNTASRVEQLTKRLDLPVLISEATYAALSDPSDFDIRFVCRTRVRGREQRLAIYEVFSGQSDFIVELKRETRVDFERGVFHFYNGEYAECLLRMALVLSRNPSDAVARRYHDACAKHAHGDRLGAYPAAQTAVA